MRKPIFNWSVLMSAFADDLGVRYVDAAPTRDLGPMTVTPTKRKGDSHRGYEKISEFWLRVGVVI